MTTTMIITMSDSSMTSIPPAVVCEVLTMRFCDVWPPAAIVTVCSSDLSKPDISA